MQDVKLKVILGGDSNYNSHYNSFSSLLATCTIALKSFKSNVINLTGKPVTDHAFTTDFQKADMKSFYMAMKSNSGDAAIKSVTRRKTLNKRQPSRNQVRKIGIGLSWIRVEAVFPKTLPLGLQSTQKKVATCLILTRMCAVHTNPLLINHPQTLFERTYLCPNIRDGRVCVKI